MALVWQLGAAALSQGQPQSALSAKNVLVLYSEDIAHPAHELTARGIRSAFRSNRLFEVQVYNEYLDLSRFKGPAIAHTLADYLLRKYAGLKVDVIIAVYPTAADFLLNEASDLFPAAPIVAQVTRGYEKKLENSPRRRSITGTIIGDNLTGVLDAALQMRPGTKRVAFVGGAGPNDIFIEKTFRKGLELYREKLEIVDLTGLPMQEILTRVGSLPPDTIVLYSNLFTDGAGQEFVPREALELISRAANAPVFGLFDSLLGYGIVGGRLMSLEEQGREAAAIALRIMGGESPASIPFGGEQAYVNAYDWRQLRRWSLSEDALPKGSIIINREFTLWDFRFYILGAMIFGLAETVLIIFLIVQRRRKRAAEKALQKKTDELDQFFNISPDLLCIANTDGYFLRLNSAWERIFGYTREELLTKRFLSFVHPDDLDGTRQALSTLASQQEVFFFQNRYCCKDGTYRWLEWSSAPVGTLIYAAARDITERKRAEAEIALARAELLHVERSSRLGELTVSLAHELNQPLAAILSSAQAAIRFLQSPTPDLNLFRTILQNIIQDDKRAAGVITSLRAMMKREEREREPLDMNAVLDNVLTLFNAEAIVRNVTIERDFDKSLSPVLGDKIQLQQVLLNLIMNAAEAMAESSNEDEKRRIILGTKATDQGIQVTVRDFGPGIDPARRDDIWQPFFTTKSAGLGMGLGVCRSIILSHHGRISAENHPEGGAMFTFEIPVIGNQ
jgi:PAS domain S-box-containing protein